MKLILTIPTLNAAMFITSMLALAISWNRRMLEDMLYRLKETPRPSAARRRVIARRRAEAADDEAGEDRDAGRAYACREAA